MLERFSKVMGEIEKDLGTNDLNVLVLTALRDSLRHYKGRTVEESLSQLEEIIHIFNNTDPRYAIVIYNIHAVYKEIKNILQKDAKSDHPYESHKKAIVNSVNSLLKNASSLRDQILERTEALNVEGKTILIHDHSHTVQDVLHRLKKKGQKFRILVAEQDMEKTLRNIELLTAHKIPFQVVPAHMLSNIEDEIDMCFFGALTLKSTYDFVVDTGTNAIISEFHLQKKPIYVFLSSSKFSLWKARKKETTTKQVHTRKHPSKKIHFERFKFSHDRVPLSSVDFVITEEGIFDSHGIKKLYQEKFREHEDLIMEINGI
ncbi:translation initiation factor eIF-2B [Patescibacteria group bacterium]|nr:translation initiation factor eIF-2B [Patescibacteria group bacterium]MBU1703227.1 translation initiation factor eIF-2B [Patescibacteria group bacterium]MBU1953845.1 translation initiation factor eIF-2B [Patescibacteria group bacterium]